MKIIVIIQMYQNLNMLTFILSTLLCLHVSPCARAHPSLGSLCPMKLAQCQVCRLFSSPQSSMFSICTPGTTVEYSFIPFSRNFIFYISKKICKNFAKLRFRKKTLKFAKSKFREMKFRYWKDQLSEGCHSLVPSALCTLFTAYYLLPSANCPLPTAYCPLFTANRALPTVYCNLKPIVHCPLPHVTVHCPLFTIHCLMSRVYCLPTAHCPLPIANCLLSTIHCLLFTAHRLLPTAYCPLLTVHCLISTVQCPLSSVFSPSFFNKATDFKKIVEICTRWTQIP
jgi:hypothetical protein